MARSSRGILPASSGGLGVAVLAVALAPFAAGCRDKKPENLAPVASALAPAMPIAEKARHFQADAASSKVSFLMEAPIEKIYGEAPGAVEGEVYIDLGDLKKSTALLKVDLDKLTLYQQKREDEKSEFSERQKNDKQNEHARTWLEIADDAPADVRKANRFAEFRILQVDDASANDVNALAGAERKVTATVSGDFRLHGRKSAQKAKVELTFHATGDQIDSVSVHTLEPMLIDLEQYDVKPREAFGKLAQKTLSALGSKVAKAAPVQIEFTARVK